MFLSRLKLAAISTVFGVALSILLQSVIFMDTELLYPRALQVLYAPLCARNECAGNVINTVLVSRSCDIIFYRLPSSIRVPDLTHHYMTSQKVMRALFVYDMTKLSFCGI